MNRKFKILIPVFILLSIFLLLNLSLLTTKINKYNSLTSLHLQINLATNISKLIHEIQLEVFKYDDFRFPSNYRQVLTMTVASKDHFECTGGI